MKQLIGVVLIFALLLSLAGCGGSYRQVNLQEPVAIPEDGLISANIIKQLRDENAIGTFQGESNGFSYEWTIFGSDITESSSINLKMDIVSLEDGADVCMFCVFRVVCVRQKITNNRVFQCCPLTK